MLARHTHQAQYACITALMLNTMIPSELSRSSSNSNTLISCHLSSLLIERRIYRGDYHFKAAAYLYESLVDPRTKFSMDADKTAFCLAYRTDQHFFMWFDQPENSYVHRRFGRAMDGAQNMSRPGAAIEGTLITSPSR